MTSLSERVKNEAAFHVSKEERNILDTITRMKDRWVSYCLLRNCLLRDVI
jgi:hypothetical protein